VAVLIFLVTFHRRTTIVLYYPVRMLVPHRVSTWHFPFFSLDLRRPLRILVFIFSGVLFSRARSGRLVSYVLSHTSVPVRRLPRRGVRLSREFARFKSG